MSLRYALEADLDEPRPQDTQETGDPSIDERAVGQNGEAEALALRSEQVEEVEEILAHERLAARHGDVTGCGALHAVKVAVIQQR